MGHDINIMFLSALYMKLRWVVIFATPLAVRVTKIGLVVRGLRFFKQSLHRRTGLQHCVGYSQSHDHSGYYVREPVESTFRFRITTAVLTLPNFHPTVIFALGYFSVAKVVELYLHILRVSICFWSFLAIISMVNRININFAQCVRARLLGCTCSCWDMSINLSIQSFRPRALRSRLHVFWLLPRPLHRYVSAICMVQTSISVFVSNFVAIGQTVAELRRFIDLFKIADVHHRHSCTRFELSSRRSCWSSSFCKLWLTSIQYSLDNMQGLILW